jgi:subtilisin family serine protease
MNIKRFERSIAIYLSIIIVVSLFYSPTYAADNELNSSATSQTDQVIVKFKKPFSKNKIGDYHLVENNVDGDHSLVSVEVPKDETVKSAVNEINSRRDVEYVEPDYKVKMKSVPHDPYYTDQWFHKVIQSEGAWNMTKGSSDVIVAVIDDGIDLEQEDLIDQIIYPYDMYYDTSDFISVGDHGTHVAGIIAAAADNELGVSGVAPGVNIMPINVFDGDDAYTSDIINGIYYAIDNGAKIINLSLGGYDQSTALNDAIQEAYKAGLVVIAAAGNDHTSKKVYPASYSNVISVASTDSNDHLSSYSNYGNSVDITAPGEEILSTLPYDDYGYMSGTSMATPVVSGIAALFWSLHPDFTNSQVVNYLEQSAVDLGAFGKDSYFGWGRVNAEKALKLKLYNRPTVEAVSDHDTTISGKVSDTISSVQVMVSNSRGVIGTANVDSNHLFAVTIPKQTAGAILSVKVAISEDKQSLPTSVTVMDKTPPTKPIITEIGDSTTYVTGKAEGKSKIRISLGTKLVGESTVNADGTFSIKIPLQKAGAVLTIVSIDQSGNISQPLMITVKDKTGPVLSKVYPVTNLVTSVKGIAEAKSKILVKVGSKTIGTTRAASNQQFVVTIPKQKEYTKLSIVAIDRYNNQGHPIVISVLDRIRPNKPIIYPITSRSTYASGKTEPYAKVLVKTGNVKLGEGKSNSRGYYSIKIKKQSVGRIITTYVYDQGRNRNEASVKVKR